MPQTIDLVNELKIALKASGKTYAQVATHLKMSEANVKRLFSTHNFTLQRLETICQFIGYTVFDLVNQIQDQQQRISQLTQAQEQALVNDLQLLLVAICVRDQLTLQDMMALYHFDEPQCIHLLARLDKLKIIELMPQNRYRLLIASDFTWISRGPIEQFFEKYLRNEFLNAAFNQPQEIRQYLGGNLSSSSIDRLKNKWLGIWKKLKYPVGEGFLFLFKA